MSQRISPTKHRRNTANEIAHRLLDELRPDRPEGCAVSVTRDVAKITLTLDRSWEPKLLAGDPGLSFRHELSGHATVFLVSTREWKHRTKPTFVRHRLEHGWQPEHLSQAIFDGFEELRQQEYLSAWRERVYDEMQSRDFSEPLPDKVDEHPTRFEEMSFEDCEFWMAYLAELPVLEHLYKPPLPWRPVRERRREDRDGE